MKKSLCAHCRNCEEVKYDGFLCDCTGYIEDKRVEDGCANFKDDGFDRSKKALDQAIEDEVKTMYQKEPHDDYDKLVKFRNDVIDAIGISNSGYTDDWLDKFVDSQAVDIIRKAVNESTRKTSKHYMADLIATMTINGATKEELDRAIKYSASVIDAERARKELGIDKLEKKYMKVNSNKSRCRDCACLVEGNDESWCCDELEKDIHNIQDEDYPEESDSPIEYEPTTYEKELDSVDAFFDKYDELISKASRNSLLGMLNDLDNAMVCIEGHITDETESNANNTYLKKAEEFITHVALLLAQMWSDENPDIELTSNEEEEK